MMNKTLVAVVVGGLLALTNLAQAANITGDTVNVSHRYPDSSSLWADLGNQVVPTGSFNYYNVYDVFVSGTYLTVDLHCGQGCSWNSVPFNGAVLTDLSSALFTAVSIDGSSNYAGFDASRLSFDSNHIYMNFQGLDANGFLRVNFDGAVPEPAALTLFGVALFGLGAIRRRKAKA